MNRLTRRHEVWLNKIWFEYKAVFSIFSFSTTREIETKYSALSQALADIKSRSVAQLSVTEMITLFAVLKSGSINAKNISRMLTTIGRSFSIIYTSGVQKFRCLGYDIQERKMAISAISVTIRLRTEVMICIVWILLIRIKVSKWQT